MSGAPPLAMPAAVRGLFSEGRCCWPPGGAPPWAPEGPMGGEPLQGEMTAERGTGRLEGHRERRRLEERLAGRTKKTPTKKTRKKREVKEKERYYSNFILFVFCVKLFCQTESRKQFGFTEKAVHEAKTPR